MFTTISIMCLQSMINMIDTDDSKFLSILMYHSLRAATNDLKIISTMLRLYLQITRGVNRDVAPLSRWVYSAYFFSP